MTDYLLSISIHALREEGDARSEFRLCITLRFLSTPSARRATVPLMVFQTPHTDFYPRPPRGGRQEPMKASVRHRLFLSTPSARRATGADEGIRQAQAISIHALREEGDRLSRMAASSSPYFYPRPPRGGRPTTWTTRPRHRKFLSTPSARRATSFAYAGKLLFPISIHALREEGDSLIPPRTLPRWNFYPRPPRGGRQKVYDLTGYSVEFLSTPSARRATAPKTSSLVGALSFLSTPSARRATSIAFIKLDMACYFYPRPPRGGRPAPQL